ncbi:MAG: hypothetical protein M0Q13_10095 [Methanothrix sp.]|jgi:hypothetical protein|nr:hypothetical protein [Methanothrix sp.]
MLEMIFNNIVLRFIFVVFALYQTINLLSILIKNRYHKRIADIEEIKKHYSVIGKKVSFLIILLFIISIFYYILGFVFISESIFMPLPQLLNINVLGVVVLIKLLNSMIANFCIENIVDYTFQFFIFETIENLICFFYSLFIASMIFYQTISLFL